MTKENKNNLILALILLLCLCVLAALVVGVIKNFTTPAITQPQTQYIELPKLEGLPLSEAKSLLDAAEITYEVLHEENRVPNRVLKIEYLGKQEGGKAFAELGTTVKLYANEVGIDKVIYLTFDDGPTAYNTFPILEMLGEREIKATFFVLGNRISEYSEQIKATLDKGHALACHSYSHDLKTSSAGFIYASTDALLKEIELYEADMRKAVGDVAFNNMKKLFRFPGGSSSNGRLTKDEALEYIAAVRNMGYAIYDWTSLTNDADNTYRQNGESDKEYFLRSMTQSLAKSKEKGLPLIVLMHDKANTKDCLADLLDYLINEGYYFDTLENCPEYVN